jgi:general secretion pathway protein J
MVRRRRHPPVRRSPAFGFTLIELLVALALMALVSLLGWRGLDTVLRSRDRIVEQSDAMRSLSVAFGQLEEDLRRSWPVRVPGAQGIGFRMFDDDGLALEILREAPVPATGGVQRVAWRVRNGVLERGFAPWGADAVGERANAVSWQWQPLQGEVTGLAIRAYVPGRGWLVPDALRLPARPSADGGSIPQVTGLEVALERQGAERILRVFPVRD